MKIFDAEPGIGMKTLAEVKRFISSPGLQIQLGTVDSHGHPNIHPIWYYFDARTLKIYVFTGSGSKKARNIRAKKTVYFDVDRDEFPYKGVRGKALARIISDDDEKRIALVEKILHRYLKPGSPVALDFVDEVRRGKSVVLELTPSYFSTWNHTKLPTRDMAAYKSSLR